MKIAHIISIVKVDKDRDLYFQQPITLETMKIAQEFARGKVEVTLVATGFPESENLIPDYFIKAEFHKTSTLEGKFKISRKLPYFSEILDTLYNAVPDADYFIQTNADIGLQPQFYLLVKKLIDDGNDSFCINKRIIPEELNLNTIDDISVIWSTLGQFHAGHDCFVFRRELYPLFDIGKICMGVPWSETTLIANLITYAKNFKVFKNAHATFHLGDRRIWLPWEYNDYRFHNCNEFAKILEKLSKKKKKILKHETIQYLLAKVKQEYLVYNKDENYNEEFRQYAGG